MADFPESVEMKKNVVDVMTRGTELVDLFVNKNYLIDINKCSPIPLGEEEKTFSAMSLFQIDKIVYDLNENINDKLVITIFNLCNYIVQILELMFINFNNTKSLIIILVQNPFDTGRFSSTGIPK